MRHFLKPLRVLVAMACFSLLNAAFLAAVVSLAFCLEGSPDFTVAARFQFVPALLSANLICLGLLVVATLLFGRLYCSTLCPLGVLMDVIGRVRRLFGRPKLAFERPSRLKYAVFAFALAGSLCGVLSLVALLDPYSLYGRLVSTAVLPALEAALNALAAWSDAHGKYWLFAIDVFRPSLAAILSAAFTSVTLVALVCWRGRWYCNHLCPVGTALSLCAHRPLVRLKIDSSACVGCGQCERVCKAGCLDSRARTVDESRCVRCFNCLGACKKGAIGFAKA